jgi:hypothetical protein
MLVLGIVALWLGVALVVHGVFVHRRFGIGDSLRNFPLPGFAAAALLGPGAAVGLHFVLPMPPGIGVIFSAVTLNPFSAVFNLVAIALVALCFFVLSWLLNKRAAALAPTSADNYDDGGSSNA